MLIIAGLTIGVLLAFANGANDHFKGVATLFGSGTTHYRGALVWATAATGVGSLAAIYLAHGLLVRFSGKGLVPDHLVSEPLFPVTIALAAGVTVLLATRLGYPISTTHSLIGALVGAALVAAPDTLAWAGLFSRFALPLLTSPIIAIILAAAAYVPLRALRRRLGIRSETCLCVGGQTLAVLGPGTDFEQAMHAMNLPSIETCDISRVTQYRGSLIGISAGGLVNRAHFLSAGAVSFARGLNDTPKIAALLLVTPAIPADLAVVLTGMAMALGAWVFARRVAETMARNITDLNPGQGFTANAMTSSVVIGASLFGLPVSTTHVSCGALFGIGAVSGGAHWNKIGSIIAAWLITLPLAGLIAAIAAWTLGL